MCMCSLSGDIAQKDAMEDLFALVADKFSNRVRAFVHNAGGLPGFTTAKAENA